MTPGIPHTHASPFTTTFRSRTPASTESNRNLQKRDLLSRWFYAASTLSLAKGLHYNVPRLRPPRLSFLSIARPSNVRFDNPSLARNGGSRILLLASFLDASLQQSFPLKPVIFQDTKANPHSYRTRSILHRLPSLSGTYLPSPDQSL